MDARDASCFLDIPPAKVFRPTSQEWSDPSRYLSSISHLVQPDGIAKIIPPSNWRPSFKLPPQLRFPAKIQLLSELDGKSRSRRVFHEQLDLLCRKIGNDPLVLERMFRGSSLGVYDLWLRVQADGGYEKASSNDAFWQEQAQAAGGGLAADELKLVYAQYILPFDQRFSLQPTVPPACPATGPKLSSSSSSKPKVPSPPSELAATLHKFSKIAKQEARHSDYTSRDYLVDVVDALKGTALLYNSLCNPVSKFILPSSPHVPDCDYTSTDENATPSLLGPPKPDYINTPEAFKKEAAASSEGKTRYHPPPPADPQEEAAAAAAAAAAAETEAFDWDGNGGIPLVCCACSGNLSFGQVLVRPHSLLLCHTQAAHQSLRCCICGMDVHPECAIPAPQSQASSALSSWRCAACIADAASGEYGYVETKKKYTLQSFQRLAAKIKGNIVKGPRSRGQLLPLSLAELEKQYWEAITSNNQNIAVEYGSEIDCARLCPDFPVNSGGDRYSKSLWNLGRLRDATLLKHLPQPISGVTQPWVYVGMCFSSFCWHNEDMHMYSINYLHEGDEKIWYGASGDDADKFEAAATALFPQLMLMQPDLLCNLVTQIHPQDLVKQGCRIVRLVQHRGEFVVTFPRAYHAGWNSGFNVAEACNMALMPWLGYAATSIEKYSSIRKSCVFCFEAFLCRIACNDRTVITARHLLPHLRQSLEREMKLRGALVMESDDDQDEGERLCDVISLGVAVNVDGVECCSCKRLCHFSYFASSSDTLSPNTFCPNCAAASPTDSSFTLVERVPLNVIRSLVSRLEQSATFPATWLARWEAIKPNASLQPPMLAKYKDLVKLHKEAEEKLKAVDDVEVRVARSALDGLISTCERWSTRLPNLLFRALELISHVRGSTRSGASGKRRWDEVASLLAEASEACVEFDELQQLGIYEAQCNSWRLKAESAVGVCGWLNVICSSCSDDSNNEDEVSDESENPGDEGSQNAENSSSPLDESTEQDHAGPPVVDVKEIFKTSWWTTDDIQQALSSLAAVEADCMALNIEMPQQREVAQAAYEVQWARAAVAIIESRNNAAVAGGKSVQPTQEAVEELLSRDAQCCKKRINSRGGLRPAVVLALKLKRWVSDAHKWNTEAAVWLRQHASVRNSDTLGALLAKCAELDVLPSDAPAAIARMAKIVQWKADLQACFESRAAADDAANVSLLPSSVTLELLESRYKELDCIIPDHKRLEPLLRDYKRWRERHKPWSEFFLWCKAARAGCFLSGDGYDPFSTSLPSLTSPAPSSLPSKRVKSEELIPLASSAVGERRRRAGIEVAPTSATTAGKKSGKEVVSKRAEEEETDNTLYCYCLKKNNGKFMIQCGVCCQWYHGRCVHVLASDAKELEDQGLDYECARCCEIGSKAYKFRLLPFKAVDDCKTDESKKGRVVPGIADYEELKESAHALAVRPVELDVAEWGMQRVKDWLQDLLVLNNGVLRPGGSPLAESNDALLPLKLLNRINYGLAFGLDVWDALVSPCISIWCLQVNEVVKHYRRIKKKPPPKLPAPPRKKSASDDATQLTLPSYIPPCSVKPGAVPYADKLAPLQLYAALQLVVEGSDAGSYFEHACKPIVKERWHHAFADIYHDFLSSSSLQSIDVSIPVASPPPLWMGTVPLPILFVAYAILAEKGVSVTDDALLQIVTQPDVLFKGYQDVQIAAMQEHQYGMVRGASAAAYAQVFEAMAESGSLDYMLKAEPSSAAAAADDDDDDNPNREVAWWCIPPDSDLSKGKDALAALVDDCAKFWPLDGDLVLEVRQVATESHSSRKPAQEIGKVYCLCRGPDDGTEMFQCEGPCKEWFHFRCVGLAANSGDSGDFTCVSCKSGGKVPNGLSAIVIASQAAAAAVAAAAASCAPCDHSDAPAPSAHDDVLLPQAHATERASPTRSLQNVSPQQARPCSPIRPPFKIEQGEGLQEGDSARA